MTSQCVGLETLEQLVLNTLPEAERVALLDHLGGCATCNAVVAEVLVTTGSMPSGKRRALDPEADGPFAVGDKVGRYEVTGLLGSGAMGSVYRAHDAELGRDVALKVLHDLVAIQGVALLDEARALAKVTHPNVVPLYEVGLHDGHSFLAMQLVEGCTLREWLVQPRPWRQVVQYFLDAARGLAAVHDAGFVHGDFKPANVLVDASKHVRVVDFGFGRPLMQPVRPGGILQGTPAYMAPELFSGERPGAHSDQFSFFVALYEGLCRVRPFTGDPRSVVASVLEQRRPKPPPGLPGWLSRLLVRGLGPRSERFASMTEVVRLLSNGLDRRRASVWVALAAVSLPGAVVLGVLWSSGRLTPCPDAVAMGELWNPTKIERIRAAFAATSLPFSSASFESVRQHLDQSSSEWTAMSLAACEASRFGRQRPELTERQRVCLSGRREAWRGFIESLENADTERVVSSVAGVSGLPTVAACGDLERLGATMQLPASPELVERIGKAQTLSARARVMREARQLAVAQRLAEEALSLATDAGYQPAIAAANFELGSVLLDEDQSVEGIQLLKQAAWQADQSGELEVTVTSAISIIRFQAVVPQLEDAQTWKQHAAAALEKLRQPPLLTGHFESAAGFLSFMQGSYDDALKHNREALRLLAPRLGPGAPAVLRAQVQLSDSLRRSGQYDEALSVATAAFEVSQKTLGDQHPATAATLRVIASAENRLGRYADAAEHYKTTVEILRRAFGPDSRRVANELVNLGNQYLSLDRPIEALETADEVIRIGKKLGFESEGTFLDVRVTRSEALAKLGRTQEGIDELRDVLSRQRALRFSSLHSTLDTLADLEASRGHWAEALPLYREALAHREAILGPAHPDLSWDLNGISRCSQAQGQWEASVPMLRRALELGEATVSHPDRLADTRFLLAKAIAHSSPRDPQAIRLAQQAEFVLRDFPESRPELLEARAWLARQHAVTAADQR